MFNYWYQLQIVADVGELGHHLTEHGLRLVFLVGRVGPIGMVAPLPLWLSPLSVSLFSLFPFALGASLALSAPLLYPPPPAAPGRPVGVGWGRGRRRRRGRVAWMTVLLPFVTHFSEATEGTHRLTTHQTKYLHLRERWSFRTSESTQFSFFHYYFLLVFIFYFFAAKETLSFYFLLYLVHNKLKDKYLKTWFNQEIIVLLIINSKITN